MFAEIHQDTRQDGKPHVFGLDYVRADATVGHKDRVRKCAKNLPGERGYRGNVNLNHVLLLEKLDEYDRPVGRPFELHIDLITHYNGLRIRHGH